MLGGTRCTAPCRLLFSSHAPTPLALHPVPTPPPALCPPVPQMQAAGGDAEVSAEDLSPAELAAFHRALAAGELSDTLAPWQPWWLTEEAAALELGVGGTPLVVAAEEQASAAADGEQQRRQQALLPVPPSRPLTPLATLTRAAPSPVLRGQLLDLLYSYCLTLRRYNGDWEWEAADAADTLFALSAVLTAAAGGGAEDGSTTASGDEAGGDAASVLLACVQRACRPPVGGAELRGFAVSVLSDVAAMLRLGRAVVLTALMDTSRLVEAARQQLEGGGEGGRSKQARAGGCQGSKSCHRRPMQAFAPYLRPVCPTV
mgnify:CR=1 FL=1